MKLVDLKVKEYLDVLKSDAPAPGGGSVSALAGAQGIGLFMMVTDLTIGKEKYKDFQETCLAAKEKCKDLYEKLVNGIDEDTEAFNLVSAAFKLPKSNDEEKAHRSNEIAKATLVATQVPYHTMELAYEGLKIAEELFGKSNPNAASDIGVGVLNLYSCIQGAWLNVKINLPGVKDENQAKLFIEKGTEISEDAERITNTLYKKVLESL